MSKKQRSSTNDTHPYMKGPKFWEQNVYWDNNRYTDKGKQYLDGWLQRMREEERVMTRL